MKKYIFSFIFIASFFFLILSKNVLAAPAPSGIAINKETKECAGFWGGDEYVNYPLPQGWIAYYPKYDYEKNESKLTTPNGTCDFYFGRAKDCCAFLGLKYVSDNIGKDNPDTHTQQEKLGGLFNPLVPLGIITSVCCCFILLILLVITIIILYKKKKK